MQKLTDTAREILAIERQWWQYPGTKEATVRARLDISMVRYTQLLNRLIDSEAALAHDPLTVKRLRRIRAERKRSRTLRQA